MMRYFIDQFLRIVLTLGSVIALGVLSFSGMLLIRPELVYAILQFFLAGVEGEVNYQNIDQALSKLFSKYYIQRKIAERELKLLIEDEEKLNRSVFLNDYKKQIVYVEYLREHHNSERKKCADAENELRQMQEFYINCLSLESTELRTLLEIELFHIVKHNKRQELLQEIRIKSRLLKFSWIVTVLAGISCGFASAAACNISLGSIATALQASLPFTLSVGAVYGIFIPLAIIAAMAYSLSIYNTISEMIANDTLQRWFFEIKKYLRFRKEDTNLSWGLRIAGCSLLGMLSIALVGFVTVATAGTWWDLTQKGAALMPFIIKLADWIRNITVPAYTFSIFIYNIFNAFRSFIFILQQVKFQNVFTLIKNAIKKAVVEIKDSIKETYAKENVVQFLNPFRLLIKLIEAPIRLITFMGHLVSIGVTTNNLEGVNPVVTSIVCAGHEGLTDLPYFVNEEKDKVVSGNKETTYKEETHSHEHSDIIGIVLKWFMWPLYLLSSAWQSGMSRLFLGSSHKPTFMQAFENYYATQKEKAPSKPTSSFRWSTQQILSEINEKRSALQRSVNPFYDDEITEMKDRVYANLHEHLIENLDSTNGQQTMTSFLNEDSPYKDKKGKRCKNGEVLGFHRLSFFSHISDGKSESDELIKDISARCVPAG